MPRTAEVRCFDLRQLPAARERLIIRVGDRYTFCLNIIECTGREQPQIHKSYLRPRSGCLPALDYCAFLSKVSVRTREYEAADPQLRQS
jgi:hypothetical protein